MALLLVGFYDSLACTASPLVLRYNYRSTKIPSPVELMIASLPMSPIRLFLCVAMLGAIIACDRSPTDALTAQSKARPSLVDPSSPLR